MSDKPSAEPSVKWKATPDRGSAWLIHLIVWIIVHMGRTIGRILLVPIVIYFMLTSSTRRYSWRYLKRNLNCAGKGSPGVKDIFLHYYSFANMLLDRVYFVTGKNERFRLHLHQPELVLERVARQQGVVLLGSHLGNFDALRALANDHPDIKVRALMYDNNHQKVNQALERLNPSLKDDVIFIGTPDAMIQVQQDIEQGYLIGMLADRLEKQDRSVSCQFMGRQAFFPSGPLIVSHLLKAPVIICFALHRCSNEYDVYFHLLAEEVDLKRENREQQLQKLMQQYADILEQHAINYPYNWYNFFDFWGDDVKV